MVLPPKAVTLGKRLNPSERHHLPSFKKKRLGHCYWTQRVLVRIKQADTWKGLEQCWRVVGSLQR